MPSNTTSRVFFSCDVAENSENSNQHTRYIGYLKRHREGHINAKRLREHMHITHGLNFNVHIQESTRRKAFGSES